MGGVTYAEQLAERDGDAYTYTVECSAGVDIRKNLFFAFAAKGWAIVGLEMLGMSLEDIFISIVDTTEKPTRPSARASKARVSKNSKDALEKELAGEIVQKTREAQKED